MHKRFLWIAFIVLLSAVSCGITLAGASQQAGGQGQTQPQALTSAERQKIMERINQDMQRGAQPQQQRPGLAPGAPNQPPGTPNQPPASVSSIVQRGTISGDEIALSYQDASLYEFINQVADMLGITPLLIDPNVKGSVYIHSAPNTYISKSQDLFPIFNLVLKNNNAALVRAGRIFKIVPLSQGLREGLEIIQTLPPEAKPAPEQETPKKEPIPPGEAAKTPAQAGAKPLPATGAPAQAPPAGAAAKTPPPAAGLDSPGPAAKTPPPAAGLDSPGPAAKTPPGAAAAQPSPSLTTASPAAKTAQPELPRLATHIIRVEFIPVSNLLEPLKLFMTEGGVLMPYERQNMLILTDYTDNVQKLLEIIHLLDNSFLDSDLVELVEIKYNLAADVLEDLKKIFGGKDGSTGINMVSLDRLNGILLMANSKRALEEVKRWIARFDATTGRTVQTFIYTVENGTASNIAAVISMLFAGDEGTTTSTGGQPGGTGGGGVGVGGTGRGGTGIGTGTSGGPFSGTGSSRSLSSSSSGMQGLSGSISTQNMGGYGNQYGYGAGIFGGQNSSSGPRLNQGTSITSMVLGGGSFSGLQGTVRLVSDDLNNVLIVQGSTADYAYLLETIKRLDVMPRQAIIDARIFEIDLTDDLSFGVSAALQARTGDTHLVTGAMDGATGALSASAFAFIGDAREILANLSALRQKTKVRILEAPSVLALDGTPARIQVGGSVPVPAMSYVSTVGSTTTGVNYTDTGTSLLITPRISASGTVTLQIYHDVRSPGASTSYGPTFTTTNVETTLAVKDGESVAIAGMIRESVSNARNGVPLLSDIPILGSLFGITTHATQRTELLIMITPHVIRTPERFREMTDEIRDSLRNVGKFSSEVQQQMQEDLEAGRKMREDRIKKANEAAAKKEEKPETAAKPAKKK
jgi:general secretion pathway protein D